jgi:hypothetical protein
MENSNSPENFNYKEYKEKVNKDWLDANCTKAMFFSQGMMRLIPDIGYCVEVEKMEIPQDIFPIEYQQIMDAYQKVLFKLQRHYVEINKNNPNFRLIV